MRAFALVLSCVMLVAGAASARDRDPPEIRHMIFDTSADWAVPEAPRSSGFYADWKVPESRDLLFQLYDLGDPLARFQQYWYWWMADPSKRQALRDEIAKKNDPGLADVDLRDATVRLAAGEATMEEMRIAVGRLPKGSSDPNIGADEASVLDTDPGLKATGCRYFLQRRTISPDHIVGCRKGARDGQAASAYRLGMVYQRRGDDFDRGLLPQMQRALHFRPDLKTAVRYFRQAAGAGHPAAQGRMAQLYAIGHGVKRDVAEAVRLARLAAATDDPEGLAVLGLLTLQGRGVPEDIAAGVALIRKAAERGNRMAQYTMATLCFRGHGVEADGVEALTWLRLIHLDIKSGVRGDADPADYGDLMVEPWPRTTQIGNYYRQVPDADLEAIARSAALRKKLAADGTWPY